MTTSFLAKNSLRNVTDWAYNHLQPLSAGGGRSIRWDPKKRGCSNCMYVKKGSIGEPTDTAAQAEDATMDSPARSVQHEAVVTAQSLVKEAEELTHSEEPTSGEPSEPAGDRKPMAKRLPAQSPTEMAQRHIARIVKRSMKRALRKPKLR